MDRCESWAIKKAEHQRTDVFELWSWRRLLIVPMTAKRWSLSILKEINPEYSWKEWCWSCSSNTLTSWCKELTLGKDPIAGKDWGQEEKGTTEDEMVGWHYWLNGHEFEQTLGDGEGQGSLVCWSPSGHKELDMTEWLKNKNLKEKKGILWKLKIHC